MASLSTKRRRSPVTYDRVLLHLQSIDQTVVTTREEFEQAQHYPDGGPVCNAYKKLKYKNNDGKLAESTCSNILSGNSKNKTVAQKQAVHIAVSKEGRERLPKGIATSHLIEVRVLDRFFGDDLLLAGIISEEDAVRKIELMENRRYDLALFAGTESGSIVFNALQGKTTETHSKGQWNTHITVGGILDYVRDGGAVFCICYNINEMLACWFFFDDTGFSWQDHSARSTLVEILEGLPKNGMFQPSPKATKEVKGGIPHALRNYKFTKLEGVFQTAFNFWRNNPKTIKKTIEYYNHDVSQIKSDNHQVENATFLAFRTAMSTSQRFSSFEHRNNTQVDAVVGFQLVDGREVSINLQMKALQRDESVTIRKSPKNNDRTDYSTSELPYERNAIDTFAFVIRDVNCNLTDESTWTRVMLLSARNRNLNIIKTTLCMKNYQKNKDYWIFNLKEDVERIVDKLLEFSRVPKWTDNEIAEERKAALAWDEDFKKRRDSKGKSARGAESDSESVLGDIREQASEHV